MVTHDRSEGVEKVVYCGECGTKNEKGAKFCESCGAKLEEVKEEKKEKTTKTTTPQKKVEKKPISKKTKIISIIAAVVVVALFIGYTQLKSAASPETIAKNYYEAYVKQNINKMYSYCDLGDDGAFMTKEAFKNYYTDSDKAKEASAIKNYKVSGIKYDQGNLTATVTVSYTTSTSSSASTDEIVLRKAAGKKYLFFDDWKVSLSSDDVATDYVIQVPKDSAVTVGNVKLSDSYKEKSSSSDRYDKYTIPMMFRTEYDVKVTLSNGFTITDEITPSNYYSSSTITLTEDNIDEEDKKKLADQIKADVKSLYDSAIADKAWSEVSKNFGGKDLEDLEDVYEDMMNDVDGGFFSSKLQSFDITSVEIKDIQITTDGTIEIWFKMAYKYVTVNDAGETKEHTSTDTAYTYYVGENNSLKLCDASSLPSYF